VRISRQLGSRSSGEVAKAPRSTDGAPLFDLELELATKLVEGVRLQSTIDENAKQLRELLSRADNLFLKLCKTKAETLGVWQRVNVVLEHLEINEDFRQFCKDHRAGLHQTQGLNSAASGGRSILRRSGRETSSNSSEQRKSNFRQSGRMSPSELFGIFDKLSSSPSEGSSHDSGITNSRRRVDTIPTDELIELINSIDIKVVHDDDHNDEVPPDAPVAGRRMSTANMTPHTKRKKFEKHSLPVQPPNLPPGSSERRRSLSLSKSLVESLFGVGNGER